MDPCLISNLHPKQRALCPKGWAYYLRVWMSGLAGVVMSTICSYTVTDTMDIFPIPSFHHLLCTSSPGMLGIIANAALSNPYSHHVWYNVQVVRGTSMDEFVS